MILFTTAAHPQIEEYAHPNLGRLVTPRHYPRVADTAAAGIPWAADNDAFNGFDEDRYRAMLGAIQGLPGCRWVAAPDVVGDAELTWRNFEEWAWEIARVEQPVAYVAQDGQEDWPVPWGNIACLFVGGTDAYKLSQTSIDLIAEAKRRGKWVHLGRVNSHRRVRTAKALGCDSFDGTSFSRWRRTWLPLGLSWASAPEQLAMNGHCPTCGGTDREGGTVVVAGPDEFGNYDTTDCEDAWH